ncbi:MAG: SDR family NAD(P)-dependent oxidoreductase [Pseudomonadota bacterium]
MTDPVDLSGKIALITGASRGIGAAVAKAYAKAGAHVILVARSEKGLEDVDDTIRSESGKATLMPVDLTNLEDLDKIGPTIFERFSGLDIFVGNAGLLGTLTPLTHMKSDEWDNVINVNLNANFRLIRTLDPLLQKSENGRAIFVTTGSSVTHGRAYWGSYGVSKAALETLVNTYADETKNTNMRVNMVEPGTVRTDMRASAAPGEDPMTLPTPDEIMPEFLNLAADSETRHGEIVKLY